jgi:RNA polymerase sigma-70 factor (ECF subfamily)
VDKQEAFIAAIKANEGTIFKIAAVYTHSTEDKNDLVQEIIYQLWKSYDSFQQKSGISTWIYRVALNVAIHQLKISRRNITTTLIDEPALSYAENNDDGAAEKWQLFRQQISNLNLLDKAIVMLYLDGKSYAEIAEIIGLSASNVGTKLSRIKEKLKAQISKQL